MVKLKLFGKKIHTKLLFYFSVILITTVMLTSSVLAVGVDTNTVNGTSYHTTNVRTEVGSVGNSQTNFHGLSKLPKISPNIMVNAPQQPLPNGAIGRSETSIAASTSGQDLVAGWNDAQGICGPPFGYFPCPSSGGFSGYAYSTNAGRNWTDGGAPPNLDNVYTRGDPWLDSNGQTFFYANLAINNITGNSMGVAVYRGHFTKDGNFTWTDVHVLNSPANAINPGTDLYDKESITVAKDNSGTAYVSLTNFQEVCGIPQFGFGTITLWRTHDGGNTWQGPTVVSPDHTFITDPSNPNCGYTGSLQLGSVVGIGPRSQVYVTWVLGPTFTLTGVSPLSKIMVATSLDGGATFGSPVVVGTVNDTFYNPPVALNRPYVLETPSISVATHGKDKGRVFISYIGALSPITNFNPSVQDITSSQVFLAYSNDQGKTWNNVQVVAPPPATTVKRFYPVVVTESNGNPNVLYYQSIENPATSTSSCFTEVPQIGTLRIGLAHSLVDVYWAHSSDGGLTFSNPVRVTSTTTDWCHVYSQIYPNMGDYIGAAVSGNHIFAVWADGRSGWASVYFSSMLGPSGQIF